MNLYVTAERLRLNGAVSRVYLQVGILGHADLNARPAMPAPPGKAPVSRNARVNLHAVAILPRIDMQILVQLVPLVDDTKLDLF